MASRNDSAPATAAEQQAFYAEIDPVNLAPLWERIHELVAAEPAPKAVPNLWRYDAVRPKLLKAAQMISQKDAERRTLMLENPALRGQARITDSLYTGLQLIMPGEVAAPHRHTPSAMRMVFESKDAYSSIAGEKCDMRPGDLILNQSWHWHGHAHEGEGPHISMTCLDIPLVRFFAATFGEPPMEQFPDGLPAGDGLARFGSSMLPIDHVASSQVSPLARYPFERTRESLHQLARAGRFDPCHAIKLEYVNPATGGPVLPTMSAFMQLMPAGFATLAFQSTASFVYAAIEGSGRTTIGDRVFTWGPHDIFAVPAWFPHRHEADEESVLYSFSDRGVLAKLGLLRERRGQEIH
ncbi:MAG TPA: cupin domain-containing protein [Stellaceae bacterium]|nr:cupin domain-containing protein [Stellaceae bacterium]